MQNKFFTISFVTVFVIIIETKAYNLIWHHLMLMVKNLFQVKAVGIIETMINGKREVKKRLFKKLEN